MEIFRYLCFSPSKGTAANSEPETQAIAAAIQQHKDKVLTSEYHQQHITSRVCIQVRIYVSFHSFGQYWLTSWGYKTELPVDNEKLVQSVECYLLCRYNSSL